jgi:hypothetical protein
MTLKNDLNVPSKVIRETTLKTLKVIDENSTSRIRIRSRGTDPRIRIHKTVENLKYCSFNMKKYNLPVKKGCEMPPS